MKDVFDEIIPLAFYAPPHKKPGAGISVKDMMMVLEEYYPEIDAKIHECCGRAISDGRMTVEDHVYKLDWTKV
jgi:hypothetical protein